MLYSILPIGAIGQDHTVADTPGFRTRTPYLTRVNSQRGDKTRNFIVDHSRVASNNKVGNPTASKPRRKSSQTPP